MKRHFGLLVFLFLLAFSASAQPDSSGFHPGHPLNADQLREEKWYYSINDALANPADVYKLSLTDQALKTLPAEIGQLKNLQILNLSNCKLKTIPAEIKELKNLQSLSLYNNKLKFIPLEFRELDHLEVLYLGKNKLTELPIWMGGLGQLRRLDISRNRITPLEIIYIKNLMPKVQLTY